MRKSSKQARIARAKAQHVGRTLRRVPCDNFRWVGVGSAKLSIIGRPRITKKQAEREFLAQTEDLKP